VINETVHEDGTKAAKTPLMIYSAKLHYNILSICQWQNEGQRSVNNFWSRIIGTLCGDRLRPFINAVLAGLTGKRQSHNLPAPF